MALTSRGVYKLARGWRSIKHSDELEPRFKCLGGKLGHLSANSSEYFMNHQVVEEVIQDSVLFCYWIPGVGKVVFGQRDLEARTSRSERKRGSADKP